ncbi:hypothetical protein PgNI_10908 [Pyricularia grisea]|uniref:Uncharacterized protein n=1 Tax=Pyricularia grisea TaxID=148305 RepID=A0A6P8AYD4_PYRGI|nr:hypothetical protein PgNI_10908 [Pyricularia grisea]TLD07291.1 hypothetical protein PgNI_10908 [Pyricularia grisea]
MQFSTIATLCLVFGSTLAVGGEIRCNIAIQKNNILQSPEQQTAGNWFSFFVGVKPNRILVAQCRSRSYHNCNNIECRKLAKGYSAEYVSLVGESGSVGSLGRDPQATTY